MHKVRFDWIRLFSFATASDQRDTSNNGLSIYIYI